MPYQALRHAARSATYSSSPDVLFILTHTFPFPLTRTLSDPLPLNSSAHLPLSLSPAFALALRNYLEAII